MPAGLERVMGIEPTFTAWEAVVLPLDDTRDAKDFTTLSQAFTNWRAAPLPG
jgi:hypothetical protein